MLSETRGRISGEVCREHAQTGLGLKQKKGAGWVESSGRILRRVKGNLRTVSLSVTHCKDTPCYHCYIMENIISSLTYFALQRNVYLKFLGVLSKGL